MKQASMTGSCLPQIKFPKVTYVATCCNPKVATYRNATFQFATYCNVSPSFLGSKMPLYASSSSFSTYSLQMKASEEGAAVERVLQYWEVGKSSSSSKGLSPLSPVDRFENIKEGQTLIHG